MAGSPDTLAGLLVNKVLAAGLARPLEHGFLFIPATVVGDDGRILLVCFDQCSTSLATGNDFGLGALRRVSSTFGAADMLTIGTLLGRGESGIALVASPANAHADRLVHAKDSIIGRRNLPIAGLDVKAESLAEILGPCLEQLGFGESRHALHRLKLGPGLLRFGQGGLLAAVGAC